MSKLKVTEPMTLLRDVLNGFGSRVKEDESPYLKPKVVKTIIKTCTGLVSQVLDLIIKSNLEFDSYFITTFFYSLLDSV